MTDIAVAHEVLEERFGKIEDLVDSLDGVLNGHPGPVDGGAAMEYIGVYFQTAVEGLGNLADTHRALIAVARDVIDELGQTDENAAATLSEMSAEF